MLTLYQPTRAWGTPNFSPFCAKLETYLRMADIPYQVRPGDPRKAPRGKVPYIEHEGRLLGDSSHIIDYLKRRFGDTVDGWLTREQHALGRLVQRTLEEGTYWCGMYNRWVEEENFQAVKKVLFAPWLPPPLVWVVPDLIRRRVLKTLYLQGTSRHTRAEIYEAARNDLAAVSTVFGGGPFLFGERACSYDAVIYAFTSAVYKTPLTHDFGALPANLGAHLELMQSRYFADLR